MAEQSGNPISMIEKNRFWTLFSAGVLLLYLLPLVVYGENLYIRIHDNLDIMVPMLKILGQSGMIFSDSMAIIPNMMGGLPRLVYGSEWNYLVWLFFFFKPITAIIINEIVIHSVAYISMAVVLDYLLKDQKFSFKIATVHLSALLFALTPFFPTTGLGIALLPYALYLLMKIRSYQDTKTDWVVLSLIPFFSSFVLVYLFFLVAIGVMAVGSAMVEKKINMRLIAAIGVMTLLFLGIEYRLVYEMFIGHDFISHRVEFQRQCVDIAHFYRGVHNVLLFGQVHSLNLQFPYILPIVNVAFLLLIGKENKGMTVSAALILLYLLSLASGIWEGILMSKYYPPFVLAVTIGLWIGIKGYRLFLGLFLFILAACVWYGLWYYEAWCILSKGSMLLRTFDFSRFVLLLTPVWYLVLALAFSVVMKKVRYGWVVVMITGALQLSFAFDSAQYFQNPTGITYRKFYDEPLFEEIKTAIGEEVSNYRVASVGIPPAAALYNGFYTVDGYAPNYPLSYKREFRLLVEENFIHNENSRRFIENWGSKCYLIAGNYDNDIYERGKTIDDFYLNARHFYAMGGRYLLSGYKIRNDHSSRLTLIRVFHTQNGYWSVYLYKVNK